MVDIDLCLDQLLGGQVLSERNLRLLCVKIKEIMVTESNVHHVRAPVTLVGDLHGQFSDLLELLRVGGQPS